MVDDPSRVGSLVSKPTTKVADPSQVGLTGVSPSQVELTGVSPSQVELTGVVESNNLLQHLLTSNASTVLVSPQLTPDTVAAMLEMEYHRLSPATWPNVLPIITFYPKAVQDFNDTFFNPPRLGTFPSSVDVLTPGSFCLVVGEDTYLTTRNQLRSLSLKPLVVVPWWVEPSTITDMLSNGFTIYYFDLGPTSELTPVVYDYDQNDLLTALMWNPNFPAKDSGQVVLSSIAPIISAAGVQINLRTLLLTADQHPGLQQHIVNMFNTTNNNLLTNVLDIPGVLRNVQRLYIYESSITPDDLLLRFMPRVMFTNLRILVPNVNVLTSVLRRWEYWQQLIQQTGYVYYTSDQGLIFMPERAKLRTSSTSQNANIA